MTEPGFFCVVVVVIKVAFNTISERWWTPAVAKMSVVLCTTLPAGRCSGAMLLLLGGHKRHLLTNKFRIHCSAFGHAVLTDPRFLPTR